MSQNLYSALSRLRNGIMGCFALVLSFEAAGTGYYTITFGPEGGTKEISTPAVSGRTAYTYNFSSTGVYKEDWIEDVWAWGSGIEFGQTVTTWHSLIRLENGMRYAGIQRYITGYENAFKIKVKCARNTTTRQRSFGGKLNERDYLTIVQEAGDGKISVSFDSNGGSSCAPREYTVGESYGYLPQPTKAGYTFGGWHTDSSLSNMKLVGVNHIVSESVKVLYAKWVPVEQKVTVSFESNGGGYYEARQYIVGDRYDSLPYPGKSGYSFDGWFSDLGLTQRITTSSTVSSSVTILYAKYVLIDYPSLDPPSAPSISIGTYGANANSDYIEIKWDFASGATSYDIYRSTSETRPDYPLAKDVSSPYRDNKASGLVAGTLYYYWVAARNDGGTSFSNRDWGNIVEKETAKTYVIRLHRNNSLRDGATAGRTYTIGKARALPKIQNELKWAPRKGYDFLGWSTTADAASAKYTDGQSLKDLTTTAGATVHLYAVWKAHKYIVRLHRNNSKNDGATTGRAFDYDQVRFLPTMAELKWVRSGYMFLGWSQAQSSSTVKYADGLNVFNLSPNDGEELHVWGVWKKAEANAYLLRLHRNNSERDGATAGRQLKLNTNRKLPTVKELGWTRTDATFKGWATTARNAAAGKVAYKDGATVKNLVKPLGDTAHLYAVWQ